ARGGRSATSIHSRTGRSLLRWLRRRVSRASASRRSRGRFASLLLKEWVRIQLAATPLAALLEGREPPQRERLAALVGADVGERLARVVRDGGLAFPQEVHVALAMA